uniref:Uncharacterized protein n=1 Tax=Arundo donax TaxID=35708 RepID=A0A0A8YM86_ARUDO
MPRVGHPLLLAPVQHYLPDTSTPVFLCVGMHIISSAPFHFHSSLPLILQIFDYSFTEYTHKDKLTSTN